MRRKEFFKQALQKLLKNKWATFCAIVLTIELILVIFAPLFTKYQPEDVDVLHRLAPGFWNSSSPLYDPSHLLGTDHLGRDILSRLLYGGRVSLGVGLCSTLMGLFFGVILGMLAGYYKKLDNIIMRIMDILFTFPGILLALLIVAVLGVSIVNAAIAISIWSIPSFARMVRGKVLQIKEEDYILAIRSLGASDKRILLFHVLKNALPVIIVIATMRMASSIMSIATLSYLGLGCPPPTPEWGGMIATAKDYMYQAPFLIIIPGITVMVTVVCLNILGDKLRDILDPSLKD